MQGFYLLSLTHDVIRASILESQTPLEQLECEVYTIHCIFYLVE